MPLTNATLNSDLQISQNNHDLFVQFSFQYRFTKRRWRFDINPQLVYDKPMDENSEFDSINRLTTSWIDGDRFLSDVNVSVSAIDDRSAKSIETSIDIAADSGHATIDATYLPDSNLYHYSANLTTSLLLNKSSFALGGKSPARSALIFRCRWQGR